MTAIDIHHTNGNGTVTIDHQAILKSLNLNPTDPKTQALLLVCDRYNLDPLLKHAVLIQGSLYVTRDGLLAVAHRSGQFDGIEVLEQNETPTHHTAKVAVYRKDMGRPFTYIGRYPKNGGNKAYGPEMAVKCAEVMALRRAFNVTGIGASDERWDTDDTGTIVPVADPDTGEIQAIEAPTTRRRPPPVPAGHVTVADAKRQILDAYIAQGIEAGNAKQSATVYWGAANLTGPSVEQAQVDRMLAEIAEPSRPVNVDNLPEGDINDAPF